MRQAKKRRHREPNRLLRALPAAEYQRFLPRLTMVSLDNGDVVSEARGPIKHVYFPRTAVFSNVSIMKNGAVAEVGTVGDEGIAGLSAFLGVDSTTTRCLAQIAGDAGRIGVRAFRTAVAENDGLHALLLRYTHAYMSQVAQTAACNRLHDIRARCARWLLMTDDRVAGDDGFFLTQQHLSYMLGVRREAVSGAAQALQAAGLIHYSRGHMTVTDRRGLEAAACECYETVIREHKRLLG